MNNNFRHFLSLLLTSILIFISVPFSTFADDTPDDGYKAIVDTGFESGEYDGWTSFGSKSELSITDEKAYGGFLSLRSHNRTEIWSGPSLNLTDIVVPGEEYLFRVYAICESSEEMTVNLTLKYVDVNGAESYNNIAGATVNRDEWMFIEGTAIIPDNIKDAVFYIESGTGTEVFCIDDVSIYGKSKPKNEVVTEVENTSLEFDFENDLEGWIPRGDILLEVDGKFSYSGGNSLFVSERTEDWNVPMVRLTNMIQGGNYTYSAYVMYIDKKNDEDRSFSICVQYNFNGEAIYYPIKSKLLQNGTWSKISGDFILPVDATDVYFYVRADDEESNELSFYVDNVKIVDSTAIVRLRKRNAVLISLAAVVFAAGMGFVMSLFIKKSRETKAAIRASSLDSMTGACNRNTYEEFIAEMEKNPEKCENLYVMACDVNFLKYINDNYGHDSGDKAIIRCAGVLLRVFGKKGTVYRIGGDEFMCFSTVNLTDAVNVEFARENIDYKGYPFSAAVGTAHYDPQIDLGGPDIKALIARSDKAMYNHKIEIKKSVDFID